ncbi:MAG: hypothetical protein AAGI69_00005 [Cyanobacteria bacterium P01_H01_bin.21]
MVPKLLGSSEMLQKQHWVTLDRLPGFRQVSIWLGKITTGSCWFVSVTFYEVRSQQKPKSG